MDGRTAAADRLLRRLERLGCLGPLDAEDRAIVRDWPVAEQRVAKGHKSRDGSGVRFVVSGVAARCDTTRDGRRRIISFHLPGDFVDQPRAPAAGRGLEVIAISELVLGVVPARVIDEAARERPAIERALWQLVLAEAAITRQWLLSIGHRGAEARVAHLLCEMCWRLEAAGEGGPTRFTFPLTQEQLGAALGLTAVHVNRTLRSLKVAGVIGYGIGHIEVQDSAALCRMGEFDPRYLKTSKG